jgi:hypothetical protein
MISYLDILRMLNIRVFSLYRSSIMANFVSYMLNMYLNFRDYKLRLLLPLWQFIYLQRFWYYSILDRKEYPQVKVYDREFGEAFVDLYMVSYTRDGEERHNGLLCRQLNNLVNLHGILTLDVLKMVIPSDSTHASIRYSKEDILYINLVKNVMSDTWKFEEKIPIMGGMLTFCL